MEVHLLPSGPGAKKGSFGKFGITSSIFNAQRVACSLSVVEIDRYNPGDSHFNFFLSIGFEFDREKAAPSSLCQHGLSIFAKNSEKRQKLTHHLLYVPRYLRVPIRFLPKRRMWNPTYLVLNCVLNAQFSTRYVGSHIRRFSVRLLYKKRKEYLTFKKKVPYWFYRSIWKIALCFFLV